MEDHKGETTNVKSSAGEELRGTREANRASRAEVVDLLESITDAFFALDADWRFTYVNAQAEELLGRRREELLDKSVWEEFPEAVDSTFDEQYHRAAREQVSVQFEEWYPPLETWFEVMAYPREKGGVSVFFNNINERKKRERELLKSKERAQKAKEEAEAASLAKSRFLANMSHELRTPLNAVIGYSEMYMEEPEAWEREKLQEDMRRIHGAGQQLSVYFDDILNLAKAKAGRLKPALGTFRFSELVEEVTGVVRPHLKENGNTLTVEGVEGVGQLCTDRSKLRQILHNLLSNAAKYTQEGQVILRARLEHRLNIEGAPRTGIALEKCGEVEEADRNSLATRRVLVVQVSDTGLGMTENEQERIFEAFELGEETAGVGSIGLGLSITHDLCEVLGGQVEVESEKDVGSTFTAKLPVETTLPPLPST